LAIGCEDGCVRLISLWDDEFEHLRRLDAVKCRLLSLAWGPLEEVRKGKRRDGEVMDVDGEEEGTSQEWKEYEDAYLVAGCSDSSLRKWDVRSGRSVFRMTTDKVRGEHTLVWAVGVLR
jgi:U3 small nucleolar RNA-associated protein 4